MQGRCLSKHLGAFYFPFRSVWFLQGAFFVHIKKRLCTFISSSPQILKQHLSLQYSTFPLPPFPTNQRYSNNTQTCHHHSKTTNIPSPRHKTKPSSAGSTTTSSKSPSRTSTTRTGMRPSSGSRLTILIPKPPKLGSTTRL